MAGWGRPRSFLLMYADSWSWVIAANIFLGINQGLAWSATVIMKVDIVGQKNRGLAMGIKRRFRMSVRWVGTYWASSIVLIMVMPFTHTYRVIFCHGRFAGFIAFSERHNALCSCRKHNQ
ncbi:MAG: hypothetical protein IPP43_14750 [Chitinophagaceae bacterium]|nr:hypothetical protein [Chitinophagaceae bacterium]